MKKKVVLLCILSAVFLYACGGEDGGKGGKGGNAARQAPPPNVRVWTAAAEDVVQRVEAVGTIEPEEEVVVSAEVAARVTRIFRDEGERVKRGGPLAVLDEKKFSLGVAKTGADLRKAGAELDYAEKDLKRKEELAGEGMVTREAYDEALAARDAHSAEVESFEAALELAKRELRDSRVTSPLTGFISERYVSRGSYVKDGDELFSVIDIDPVKVSASIPERYLGEVRTGQQVRVRVESAPDGEFTGTIYFISPSLDEDTRTFKVKARIPNPYGLLKPGLFADVRIVTGMKAGIFLVPESGVITRGGKSVLFVVSDGAASRRELRVGKRHGGKVEVLDGIGEGEKVVVDGAHGLTDGAKVNVVD
ncbi:MAG: efflux RND transporter periplasmic adaptor subunit [Thermodesulfobacteriota bacterium]